MTAWKRALTTLALLAGGLGATGMAQASNVSWSVGVSAPGVSVGVAQPAPLYTQPAYAQPVYAQPVYAQPAYVQAPPVYVQPRPVYVGPPVYVQPRPVVAAPYPYVAAPPVAYRVVGPRPHHRHRWHGQGRPVGWAY